MPVPTDQLSGEIKDLGLRLAARMEGVEAGLRGLREEFVISRERVDTHLASIKWVGVFAASALVATIIGAGRVIWDAATITVDVRQQGTRLEKVEKRLDGVEGRLDGMAKQLDVLIRRSEPKAGG